MSLEIESKLNLIYVFSISHKSGLFDKINLSSVIFIYIYNYVVRINFVNIEFEARIYAVEFRDFVCLDVI